MDRRTRHIEAAGARLAHLAGLAERTHDADRRILEAAQHRLAAVVADLGTLRPRVNLDDTAAARYQALTLERGQLETVIGQAAAVLA